jgi:hypothetical protein
MTRKGHEAAAFWADVAVGSKGLKKVGASFMGGAASLWTPETAGQTVLTLVTAGVAPGVAQAFPTVGKGLLVVGTGLTAYSTTLAVTELATGRDAFTDRPLSDEDRMMRVVQTVSGDLLLAAGCLQARAMAPAPGTALGRATPLELTAPGGGGYRAQGRVPGARTTPYSSWPDRSESHKYGTACAASCATFARAPGLHNHPRDYSTRAADPSPPGPALPVPGGRSVSVPRGTDTGIRFRGVAGGPEGGTAVAPEAEAEEDRQAATTLPYPGKGGRLCQSVPGCGPQPGEVGQLGVR